MDMVRAMPCLLSGRVALAGGASLSQGPGAPSLAAQAVWAGRTGRPAGRNGSFRNAKRPSPING